jgi:hypothetical protein
MMRSGERFAETGPWKTINCESTEPSVSSLYQLLSADSVSPSSPRYPYLSHVKELAKSWPHLEFLADFMEHGTPPIQGRWSPCPDDPAKVAERGGGETAPVRLDHASHADRAIRG